VRSFKTAVFIRCFSDLMVFPLFFLLIIPFTSMSLLGRRCTSTLLHTTLPLTQSKWYSQCNWHGRSPFFTDLISFLGATQRRCLDITTTARCLRTKSQTSKSNTPSLELHMPYFDAERFATLLEREGFSASQSRAVINALDDVVDER
jgi:hypothetical protein